MTKKTFSNLLKSKIVLILTVLCLIFSSACFFTACNKDSEEKNSNSISYPSSSKIEEDALIKFGNFETGTYGLTSTSFPYVNPTGWNSAAKESNAPSIGYSNIKSGLIDKNAYDKVLENLKKDISDIDTKLPEENVLFENGNRVLMLHAYSKDHGVTAVSIAQSSAITLEKDSTYKFTIDVLTDNLSSVNDEGANVKLISTVNGNTQANVIINEIDTEGAWKTYTFYITTDKYISCTAKLELGLGRAGANSSDLNTCVSGTAFFDNIAFDKTNDAVSGEEIAFTYGNTGNVVKSGNENQSFKYDMTVAGIFETSASLTDSFELNGKEFNAFRINVNVKDTATKRAYKNVKLFLDEYDSDAYDNKVNETECKVYDYSEEDQICYVLVKNNYESTTEYYKFRLENENANAPTCSIETSGANDIPTGTDKIYSLYTSLSNKTVSLYKGLGYNEDYSEPTKDSYTFTAQATVTEDDIKTKPVLIKEYKGVSTDSSYLSNKSGDNATIDDYIIGATNGGNAGLINSAYTYDGISGDLTKYKTTNKEIQPIFIKNATEGHYGFIGPEKTISTSSYATISVRVRVVESAIAYIYIVQYTDDAPAVMKLNDNNLALRITGDMMQDDEENNGWVTVRFFIATGATSKKFRIELWNGGRTTDEDASQGIVFFDDVQINTSASNFETTRWEDFFGEGGPLVNYGKASEFETETFKRKLTDKEKAFNKDYPLQKVEYRDNYIWAKNDTVAYAVYNTIDPVAKDPYATITKDEDVSGGCSCNTDPSTFWLSFSSIALVAVIIVALAALIIKNVLYKRKKHASDIKSHYKVQSRISKKDKIQKEEVKEEIKDEEQVSEENENANEEQQEQTEQPIEEEKKEETLDSYVYGDVQDFGETEETNEQEEVKESEVTEENKDDQNK